MFTTEITTIAGQPITISQPVCKQRRFFITGNTKSRYEIHSRTVAQWEVQIGKYKEVMEIVHHTNNIDHCDTKVEKPFVSLSTSTEFEPLIHLGNRIVHYNKPNVAIFNCNGYYFKFQLENVKKALSETLDNNEVMDLEEFFQLAMLMREAYEYVVNNMVITNLSDIKINCEGSIAETNQLISKSLDELIDHEIIWSVYHPNEIGTKGVRDHLRVEKVLNEHRALISNNLYDAELAIFDSKKQLENKKSNLDALNKQIEENKNSSSKYSEFYANSLSKNLERANADIEKNQKFLSQNQARFTHTKERLATNTKARLHAGIGGMKG